MERLYKVCKSRIFNFRRCLLFIYLQKYTFLHFISDYPDCKQAKGSGTGKESEARVTNLRLLAS